MVSLVLLGSLVSWETALIVVSYGAVVIALDYFRVARVNPALDAAIERTQENSRLIGNAVGVIETLRHTRSERWMAKRFQASAGDAFANWRRYSMVSSVFSAASGIALAVQLVVTFFLLLPRYEAGSISIGEVVLFNPLLLQLNEPFHLVGEAMKEGADALGRFRPFAALWNAPEEAEPETTMRFHPSEGTIAFQGVSFTYANGRGVRDLSFEVRRGAPELDFATSRELFATMVRRFLKPE